VQVLASELPGLVSSLSFKKSMRWDGFGVAYSRPMRWLMALHGNTPISFSYGGLVAEASTRVLRNAPQPQLQVPAAGSYLELLQKEAIQLDFAARRKAIWEGASAAAAEVRALCLRPARLRFCFLTQLQLRYPAGALHTRTLTHSQCVPVPAGVLLPAPADVCVPAGRGRHS
jgi:hypothetical protein